MDFDGDGDTDILGGSYTGELYLFDGGGGGVFAQGVRIADQAGNDIKIEYSVTVEAVDMDADRDLDLVVGTRSGPVYVVRNVGTRTQPVWAADHEELKTAGGTTIEGSNAHHADWDGDGVRDLVVGSERGRVRWYRNVGANDAPRYAEGAELLAQQGSERLVDDAVPTYPGTRVKVHVTDWNGDGRADLLVGDAAVSTQRGPALTEVEEREKSEIEPRHRAALSDYSRLVTEQQMLEEKGEAVPAELAERVRVAKEGYQALSEEMRRFRKDKTVWHGWVWLYLRKAEAGGDDGAELADDRRQGRRQHRDPRACT